MERRIEDRKAWGGGILPLLLASAGIWIAAAGLSPMGQIAHGQSPGPTRELDIEADTDADEDPIVSDSGVGYIDNAILGNQFRFRFDAAYHNTQPARAEFFWAVDGAIGPGPGPERAVNYQDFLPYLEIRPADDWSVFVELPFRLIDPVIQDNTAGLADMNAGFKYGLVQTRDRATTAQLRVYAPTGDATRGLGNHHVSLEPALLHYERLTDRLSAYGELRDWIAVGGTPDFAGNVLRYGLGASLQVNDSDACHPLRLVGEFVGWTVLEGGTVITTDQGTITADARGDTIVNAKTGFRWTLTPETDFYAGYGFALTEAAWYDDTLRFELRHRF